VLKHSADSENGSDGCEIYQLGVDVFYKLFDAVVLVDKLVRFDAVQTEDLDCCL
jgi:hypothetical protein